MSKKIPLVEMFGPTIQGEGAVIGQQTYFLRFGLCDYKCAMCDSMNAVDPLQVQQNAQWLTQEEIADKFFQFWKPNSTKWVTFSGGNLCIHDLSEVCKTLWNGPRFSELPNSDGYGQHKIVVETQGTKCPDWLLTTYVDIISVSPKGPGMGEKTVLADLDAFIKKVYPVKHKMVFKIVIFDQRDIEFAKMIHERYEYLSIPMYLSLGNPYPPGKDSVLDTFPKEQRHMMHMNELVRLYRILFEDIQTDPILSQMRFLPQWHVFPWGNEKGK